MNAEEKWTKAERLHVAAQIAPALRSTVEKTRVRRVGRVDADGNVVGYTTVADLQKSLLLTKALEIAVDDGVPAKELICDQCGKPGKVRRRQRVTRCDRCTFLKCKGCGVDLPRNYSSPSIAKRQTQTCLPCRKAKTVANSPRCVGCSKPMDRRQLWSHINRCGGSAETFRCRPCATAHRRAVIAARPKPTCSHCGEFVSEHSAKHGVRAKAGRPPLCKRCYLLGHVRRAVALQKMKDDPVFAAQAKAALAEGRAKRRQQ